MSQAIITNWNSANLRLHTKTAEAVKSRKVANNTYLVRLENDDIAVRHHNTHVLTYHYDGTITLNSGGYRTQSTISRMNRFLPAHIRVFLDDHDGYDMYVWYRHESKTEPFVDGMMINPKES